jgi:hypothetical protein
MVGLARLIEPRVVCTGLLEVDAQAVADELDILPYCPERSLDFLMSICWNRPHFALALDNLTRWNRYYCDID